LENVKAKILSWGASWLNLAVKVVLLKSVLNSLTIYQGSILLAPTSFLLAFNKIRINFLWQGGKSNGVGEISLVN
jgi:hypothetical protein